MTGTLDSISRKILRTYEYDPATGLLRNANSGRVMVGRDKEGYLCVAVMDPETKVSKNRRVHRVAFLLMTGAWPKGVVNHINGDRTDNRWVNLEDVAIETNNANTAYAIGKDRRILRYNGKYIPVLHAFDTYEEAEAALELLS